MEYIMCKTMVRTEETESAAETYGIVLMAENGGGVLCVPDVSPDKDAVQSLVILLNQKKASVLHFEEIIADFIGNEEFFIKN